MPRKIEDALDAWKRVAEAKDDAEIARYRAMSPEAKLREVDILCRDGITLLQATGRRDLVASYRDPLPASSRAILARLRREHRERRAP